MSTNCPRLSGGRVNGYKWAARARALTCKCPDEDMHKHSHSLARAHTWAVEKRTGPYYSSGGGWLAAGGGGTAPMGGRPNKASEMRNW